MPDSVAAALRAAAEWVIWLWRQPYGPFVEVPVGVVILVAVLILASAVEASDRERIAAKKALTRAKPVVAISTRAVRPRGAVYIPLELGGVTVDLQPTAQDTRHTVLGGISGLGKSTAVLPLFDLPCGVLCVALDNTRPIAAKVRSIPDGIEWTNEFGSPGWGRGLALLNGSAVTVAEGLVAGWAAKTAGDTGKYRDIAEDRLLRVIRAMDGAGLSRDLEALTAALMLKTGNVEADRACQDWGARLLRLSERLGPALGDDLDLVQAMRDRQKVLLRLNRFLHPRLAPMLGGMLLVHARRTAQEAGVPFVLIVEEAGQMEQYQEQMTPLAQAGRDRGVPLVVLTQNMAKLPVEVVNNVKVWVSFGQEARTECNFAADRLRLEPEQLQLESFKDAGVGWCYVRAPRVPTSLVRIKQQRITGVSVDGHPLSILTDTPVRTPRMLIREIDLQRIERRGLPAPSQAESGLLANVYAAGECERWRGKHDRAGHRKDCAKDCADRKHLDGCYGLVWWQGKWQRVHRVRWELAFGPIGFDGEGKPLTIDHQRTCPRDCSRLHHLDRCTGPENSKRRWRVRGVGAAAD